MGLVPETAEPDISIHALLAESDSARVVTSFWFILFLSTLSLRRATSLSSYFATERENFYPRSPCGERRLRYLCYNSAQTISIHALLAESDSMRT